DLIDASHAPAGQPLPTNGDDVIYGLGGNDTISGLGGNDLINGGLGADTMYGGSGNDRFVVDNAGDHAIELPGEGTDTLLATVSYALDAGSEIESLRAQVNTGITLTGNEFGNQIVGGRGNDIIIGGGGRDILTGGAGHDTFVFNEITDSPAGLNRDKIVDFVEG